MEKYHLRTGMPKLKIVETECQVESLKEDLKKQLELFDQHGQIIREQYQHIKQLKESLPEDEIIVQTDFAEFFSLSFTGSDRDSWTSPDESTSSVTVSDRSTSTHPSVQSDVAMDPTVSENDTSSPAFVGFKGDFVATVYDGKWYLGRIE
ncbi:hypothetical protein CHS0354_016203 [Potamilus streckersoni]|uniref:Uncharacterized protein n=1 Tax=Potamilus streckersoni TaxID=2493646 RepID=A0AAE0RXK1_9BIVA|nr:hypothetical protein CHS0354_016203 [Potamilus streckersoni]